METYSSELNALLRLLDDNDQRVASAVEEKLLAYGDAALTALQPYADAQDENVRNRASRLLAQITGQRFLHEIREIQIESETSADGDIDLESGVASLARFGYAIGARDRIIRQKIADAPFIEFDARGSAEDHYVFLLLRRDVHGKQRRLL